MLISGTRLECASWGAAASDQTVLLLLHEGLGSVAMWRDFPAELARVSGLRVVVFSRQGYGQSDPATLPRPLDYMEREARDVLPGVLDTIGAERVVLVGHSDGGSIAALHQREVADPRVRGLILMAPHFWVEDLSIDSIRNVRVAWRETDLPERLGRYHADAENAFVGWNDAWLDPGFHDWDIRDCIDAFRVPCLALQGRLDEYGSARQVEIIAERSPAPVEVHLLDDCGHAPYRDQRPETLSRMHAFLDRIRDDAERAA